LVFSQPEQRQRAQMHQQAQEREMCRDRYDQVQLTKVLAFHAKQMRSVTMQNPDAPSQSN